MAVMEQRQLLMLDQHHMMDHSHNKVVVVECRTADSNIVAPEMAAATSALVLVAEPCDAVSAA